MDLATIELPKAEAEERFTEYREAVRRQHDAEDEAMMRGYKALADGKALLSLPDAIGGGGVNRQGHPNLAVGRADRPRVYMSSRGDDGSVAFVTRTWRDGRASNNTSDVRAFHAGTLPTIDRASWNTWEQHGAAGYVHSEDLFSPMPAVPPRFRPARGLHLYDVLFEVDEWRAEAPPVTLDPVLLRRLAGDLYVVCAQWDLTDLERHVLAGRA